MGTQSNNKALYALCTNDDHSKIKIGKISGTVNDLMNQYSIRYNSQGYKLLRYWNGSEYYAIENTVHIHPILSPYRIRNNVNNVTGRLTEWFVTTLEIIDIVVSTTVTEYRNKIPIREPIFLSLQTPKIVNLQYNQPLNLEYNQPVNSFPYENFISQACVIGSDKYINSARMYEFYQVYCNNNGDSNKTFVNKMIKRFTRRRKGQGGPWCYIGIDIDINKLQNIIQRNPINLSLNSGTIKDR
jgi:hypothetical protein